MTIFIPVHSTKNSPHTHSVYPRVTKSNPSNQEVKLPNFQSHKLRITLYSHDTMGLGHKRRNILIAQTLGVSVLSADILMISGMADANQLSASSGIDYLTLPALYKTKDGQYQARRLGLSLEEIIALRSQIIKTALQNFQPDVFIVDNVPRGAMGELDASLEYLKTQNKTRFILGLRDILDEPEVIRHSWQQNNHEETIRRYYDAVWIYGDQKVYDSVQEYAFSSDITKKFYYTGYLNQRPRLQFAQQQEWKSIFKSPSKRLALCMLGGGQDGENLALAFAQSKFPTNTHGIIVTGPMMPEKIHQQLQTYAQKRSDLSVLRYVDEPTFLLEKADWVISMGGYNTTCEILSLEKRALIVPRVKPRKEQLIRAQLLQKMGWIDMLHPDDLHPQTLSRWLHQEKLTPQNKEKIDLQGLERIPNFLATMLQPSS
jgi:predicted glycosyltransferase